MEKICVIFDWAGTTVDFGSCAPVEVFINIFEQVGVDVTYEEAREPMGMLKLDHIKQMLTMPRIRGVWESVHGQAPTEEDAQLLYKQFEQQLFQTLKLFTTPIEGVVEVVDELQHAGVKIGSTTGYTREMIDIVKVGAKKRGYAPEVIVTADEVGQYGRPAPYMIFENMKQLGITDVHQVVKVGDTKADIEEGKHAGVYSIGVIVGSSEMGLTEAEYDALDEAEKALKIKETKNKFITYGADATIMTMKELPAVLDELTV